VDIFLKAWEYINSGKVKEEDKTESNIYFKVGKHSVNFPLKNSWQHEMVCTCTYGSLQGVTKNALCSHKIAVLVFKTLQFKLKKEE